MAKHSRNKSFGNVIMYSDDNTDNGSVISAQKYNKEECESNKNLKERKISIENMNTEDFENLKEKLENLKIISEYIKELALSQGLENLQNDKVILDWLNIILSEENILIEKREANIHIIEDRSMISDQKERLGHKGNNFKCNKEPNFEKYQVNGKYDLANFWKKIQELVEGRLGILNILKTLQDPSNDSNKKNGRKFSRRYSTVQLSQRIHRILSTKIKKGKIDSKKLEMQKRRSIANTGNYKLWIKSVKLKNKKISDLKQNLKKFNSFLKKKNYENKKLFVANPILNSNYSNSSNTKKIKIKNDSESNSLNSIQELNSGTELSSEDELSSESQLSKSSKGELENSQENNIRDSFFINDSVLASKEVSKISKSIRKNQGLNSSANHNHTRVSKCSEILFDENLVKNWAVKSPEDNRKDKSNKSEINCYNIKINLVKEDDKVVQETKSIPSVVNNDNSQIMSKNFKFPLNQNLKEKMEHDNKLAKKQNLEVNFKENKISASLEVNIPNESSSANNNLDIKNKAREVEKEEDQKKLEDKDKDSSIRNFSPSKNKYRMSRFSKYKKYKTSNNMESHRPSFIQKESEHKSSLSNLFLEENNTNQSSHKKSSLTIFQNSKTEDESELNNYQEQKKNLQLPTPGISHSTQIDYLKVPNKEKKEILVSKYKKFINPQKFRLLDEFISKRENNLNKQNKDHNLNSDIYSLKKNKSNPELDLSKYDNPLSDLETFGVWNFDFLGLIGSGGFGQVWMVRRKKTNDYYAMKILNFKGKDKNFIKDTLREKKIMQNLIGDYVVKGFFSFLHDHYYCIVMELM